MNEELKGYPVTFNIYAHSEEETAMFREAIVRFIDQHRLQGRAVTAEKAANALNRWQDNPIVRSQIIKYFS